MASQTIQKPKPLLCRLGLHKWRDADAPPTDGITGPFMHQHKCDRCPAEKQRRSG